MWIVDIVISEKDKSGRLQKFRERHVEKAHDINVVKKLLAKSGFGVVGIYADFELNKIKKDSLKWFFVCRKRV